MKEFQKLQVPEISLVVINLYPFHKHFKTNIEENALEMIDIGGPSLIRASGKNYKNVTIISDINDYLKLVRNLKNNGGNTDINFRRMLAAKAFRITAQYDSLITNWFEKNNKKVLNKNVLRYGENPNQNSFIENNTNSIFKFQLSGKEISYNNIVDIDSGYKCLREFIEPTCIIVKHSNPCGAASAENINLAFKKL